MSMRLPKLLMCLALFLARPAVSLAEERPPLQTAPAPTADSAEAHRYDGNHTGLTAGAFTTSLQRPIAGIANRGYGFHIGARFASVLQILDAEVAFEHASHGASDGSDAAWTRNELGLFGALHPGFPFAVFNSYFYDIVAGLHGYGGLSMVRGSLRGDAAVAQAFGDGHVLSGWSPCLTVGAGLDIPIWPRGGPHGLWLTVRYGLRWMGFGSHDPDLNMADSQAMVLLNWREYNTSWARLPRPF